MSDYSAPGVNGKPKSNGVKTVLKGIRKNIRSSFGICKEAINGKYEPHRVRPIHIKIEFSFWITLEGKSISGSKFYLYIPQKNRVAQKS